MILVCPVPLLLLTLVYRLPVRNRQSHGLQPLPKVHQVQARHRVREVLTVGETGDRAHCPMILELMVSRKVLSLPLRSSLPWSESSFSSLSHENATGRSGPRDGSAGSKVEITTVLSPSAATNTSPRTGFHIGVALALLMTKARGQYLRLIFLSTVRGRLPLYLPYPT